VVRRDSITKRVRFLNMQDQQQIIEQYVQAYNQFDIAGMLQYLHDDVIFENSSNGAVDLRLEGIDAFQAQAKTAVDLFESREQKITDWEFLDDLVRIGVDYTGVIAVDLPNGVQAGDTLSLEGRSSFWFKEGKIVRILDES